MYNIWKNTISRFGENAANDWPGRQWLFLRTPFSLAIIHLVVTSAKLPEKLTFFTPWYMQVSVRIKGWKICFSKYFAYVVHIISVKRKLIKHYLPFFIDFKLVSSSVLGPSLKLRLSKLFSINNSQIKRIDKKTIFFFIYKNIIQGSICILYKTNKEDI